MALSLIGALNMHRGSLQGHLSNAMHPAGERVSPRSEEGDQSVIQPSIQDWMASQFFARTRLLQQDEMSYEDESNDLTNKQMNDFDRANKKRRKQTKPVRISEEGAELMKDIKQESKEVDENSQTESGERSSLRMESNGSSEAGKFVCPYCNESLDTEPQLVVHFQEQHVNKMIIEQLKRHQMEDQMIFHQQQLMAQGHDQYNPYRYPLPSSWRKGSESPERSPNSSPKEEAKQEGLPAKVPFPFATEKMNSSVLHPGMLPFPPNPFLFPFVGNSSPMQPNAAAQPNGPQIRIFNPEAYCELCNKEFCNKYFLKTHKANKHGIYSDTPPTSQGSQTTSAYQNGFQNVTPQALDSRGNSLLQQTSPKPATIKTSARAESSAPEQSLLSASNPNLVFPSSGGSSGLLSSLMKPGTIINPDAYCELCQKEFCNKYFLKRHKSKIHGIQETTSAGTTPMPQPSSSPVNIGLKGSNYSFIASDYISSLAANPIKPEREEKLKDENQTVPQPELSSGELKPCLDPEKLKDLGVQDIEAFCDQCFKEFCNKEMLRIHKWKKHGVPLRDSPGPGSDYQNLPLDLTLSLEGVKSEEEQEQTCHMCNMSFQNQYLFQMHESYFHSSNPEGVVRDFSAEFRLRFGEAKFESNDDLQKLQSMIKDLSGQDSDKTMCKLCVRPIEKKNLATHMLKEHGNLIGTENLPDQLPKDVPPLTPLPKDSRKRPLEASNHQTYCQICKKDFFAAYFLQVHMQTVHSSAVSGVNLFSLTETPGRSFVDRMGIKIEGEGKKRNSSQPPRSYCEICNKELCNKYFMKTHMLKMHGISVDSGSPLQGVSCDICQKELSSKYFLKVHKQNAHGIFEDPPVKEEEASQPQTVPQEFCPLCQRPFKNLKWLKVHLTQDHGDQGREAWQMLMHDRQKGQDMMPPICGSCGETFPDVVSLQVHIIKHHPSQQTSRLSSFGDQTVDQSQTAPSSDLSTVISNARDEKKTVIVQKFRCKKCSRTFPTRELCLYHLLSKHRPRPRVSVAVSVRRKQAKFRCKSCGYQTRNLQVLRVHIRHRHRKVKTKLEDLPKSIAVPQHPADNGRFHMQAFLMAEPISDATSYENSHVVPSVVYLPKRYFGSRCSHLEISRRYLKMCQPRSQFDRVHHLLKTLGSKEENRRDVIRRLTSVMVVVGAMLNLLTSCCDRSVDHLENHEEVLMDNLFSLRSLCS